MPIRTDDAYSRCNLQRSSIMRGKVVLMRPSISERLEDIVLEVAAALDVEARVVPLAARVAGAALPSEAERPA
jgi:hypothetical protein